jgi:hypothetical protein
MRHRQMIVGLQNPYNGHIRKELKGMTSEPVLRLENMQETQNRARSAQTYRVSFSDEWQDQIILFVEKRELKRRSFFA